MDAKNARLDRELSDNKSKAEVRVVSINGHLTAQEKIDEALRSGATKLDLSAERWVKKPSSLSELPVSLGQLTQLKSLDLSGNNLTSLPEGLGKLTKLEILDLSGNNLTSLPEGLCKLTQLESLHLFGNQLTALPEWLSQLTDLQSLDLDRNHLESLPEWLDELTQLQSLNVANNRLITLPKSLGHLAQLRSLSLLGNGLTAIPDSIRQLSQLTSLDLSGNRRTALPEWLGELSGLQSLSLVRTGLDSFPEWMRALKNLRWLNVCVNNLSSIPNWIPELTLLEALAIGSNQLRNLPEALGHCTRLASLNIGDDGGGNPIGYLPSTLRRLNNLEELFASHCQLKGLPDWIAEFPKLRLLYLTSNQLRDIPLSLANCPSLTDLRLEKNPLNADLEVAHREGLRAVGRYLRELAKGARDRFEAKLLILGDGNEGKTCISRALRGQPFREQRTTQGVDVEQWKFPHPDHPEDHGKQIALNIWDFEGQEISHQTHQFFLTSQSLYLLVFKCRDQFLMDRAEYWLDTIRARAPKAKVAIVISQCETLSPHVPLDRLQAQYGDLLTSNWFFTVGCKNGWNVDKLQRFLQRWSADLEFMGSPWPTSYDRAEKELKPGKQTSHITRKKLQSIFARAGINQDNYEDAAASMARLGVITQFPECPDLRDFIVLRPQWLTKAISKVMEDAKLSECKGEIAQTGMDRIWKKAGYCGMFATFHDCMKEFELCYDLEDGSQSCLVPLRFGYVPPPIPWSDLEGIKERRIEYKLNVRPPMGIMSRFIVKIHHMIVKTQEHPNGIYWHNGVFIRTGEGPLCSEALCEFVAEDRKLRVVVRAAFPQNLSEQIHAYIKAILSFFGGLEAERSYGCIKLDSKTQVELRCSGLHTEKRIYSAISKQRVLDCEFEDHEIDPQKLIWGFSSFSEFVMAKVVSVTQLRQELDKKPEWAVPFLHGIGSLLDWVNVNDRKMNQLLQAQSELSADFKQEAALRLKEYLACMSEMLDDRDQTSAPGLIGINTTDRSPWNPVGYFKKTYILTPFCECEGNIHACDDGKVEFTRDRIWWEKSAPWVARATKLVSAGLLLAFAGMPLRLGVETAEAIKNEVKFMQELAKHMELEAPEESDADSTERVLGGDAVLGKDLRGHNSETILARTAVARLLSETAPNNYQSRQWGSLRRIRMSDNSYRWLCEKCVKSSR